MSKQIVEFMCVDSKGNAGLTFTDLPKCIEYSNSGRDVARVKVYTRDEDSTVWSRLFVTEINLEGVQ